MLEAESLSLWASLYNWFTPSVIFLFLNLIIGTIAISNAFSSSPKSVSEQSQKQSHVSRSQSVLQKFKSINLYNYFNDSEVGICRTLEREDVIGAGENEEEEEQIVSNLEQSRKQSFIPRSQSILQQIKSFNPYNYFNDSEMGIDKTQQREENEEETQQPKEELEEEDESRPTMDEIYRKLKGIHVNQKPIRKMKRWASTKTGFGQFDEKDAVVESRRPATMRERMRVEDADEEVDAKADDFINNFKNQLKLQRMASVLRFKEKVKTGGG